MLILPLSERKTEEMGTFMHSLHQKLEKFKKFFQNISGFQKGFPYTMYEADRKKTEARRILSEIPHPRRMDFCSQQLFLDKCIIQYYCIRRIIQKGMNIWVLWWK